MSEQFKNLEERIEFLRRNPVFWSRFGWERHSGDWEEHALNARRHKALFDRGIKVHSSIIPVGWVGPDEYDYEETDRLLELLFTTAPDILFLPRVKLNVPDGWCAAHPDDVYVYAGGPRTTEEIRALIGTRFQGAHPEGKDDLIAQQSFPSRQWKADASEAMRRFVEHIESSPWADRIIGYHLAYGTSGETAQWASWNTSPWKKGDYGVNATKAFVEYAAACGSSYDDVPPIEERFFIGDKPVPGNRYHEGCPTLEQLFYHTESDARCVAYSEFTRDFNADAAETFCKVVKDIVPEKVTGVFFGYIAEPENCANTQHTGFDRLLGSPFVDFLAGPKGYNRVGPTDPGFGQSVPNSVNRKKLWLDEIDNRTHLNKWCGPKDYPSKNFEQTRAVYWREFTKNIVFDQGYWWMDLGGGWLDSEEIQSEIALLSETSKQLYARPHHRVSEVLLVIDENAMHRMRPNFDLHYATVGYTGATVKESGVPVDFYRLADLDEIDLSGYKMIIFLNAFYADAQRMSKIIARTPADCHLVWNYAAGILDAATGAFGLQNTLGLTGFALGEYPVGGAPDRKDCCYPVLFVKDGEGVTPLDRYSDGRIRTALRRDSNGRTHIMNAMPADITVEKMRELLRGAGVHLYAPAYCVVHADSRFIYLLSEKKQQVTVTLKEPVACRNAFTGELFPKTDTLSLDMDEGTCVFLNYEND